MATAAVSSALNVVHRNNEFQRVTRLVCLLIGIGGFALRAHCAGGHFSVDDAAMLAPGQCQLETWSTRENGGDRGLMHVGPACRIGPVELGLNVERVWLSGANAVASAVPQIKWAYALSETFSAGVVLSVSW